MDKIQNVGLLTLLFLTGFLSGCETNPKVVYQERVLTVYQDRYVPVPPDLVEPIPIVSVPDKLTTIDLILMFQDQRTAARMCNGQLQAIAKLGERNGTE